MGQISTHVIDTGNGLPATGLRVRLEYYHIPLLLGPHSYTIYRGR